MIYVFNPYQISRMGIYSLQTMTQERWYISTYIHVFLAQSRIITFDFLFDGDVLIWPIVSFVSGSIEGLFWNVNMMDGMVFVIFLTFVCLSVTKDPNMCGWVRIVYILYVLIDKKSCYSVQKLKISSWIYSISVQEYVVSITYYTITGVQVIRNHLIFLNSII